MWPSADVVPEGADPKDYEGHGGIRYRRSPDPKRTPTLDVPRATAHTGIDPLSVRLSTLHQAPILSSKMVFPLAGMAALNPCAVGPRDDMVKPGDKAPDFEVTAPDGKKVRLSDFRGKPVVLFMTRIFSTALFCPICVPGLEQMDEMVAEFRRRGIEVMNIASTSVERAREFAEALGVSYPLYADPEWQSFKAYGAGRLGSLPLHAWAVVDGQGIVRFVWRLNGPDVKADLPMPAYVLDQVDTIFAPKAA